MPATSRPRALNLQIRMTNQFPHPTRPLRNRYRREPGLEQWVPTLMEAWALEHDRFIGESLRDDEADLQLRPHERPKLVRLGALALGQLPGGVLMESLNDLGDHPLARAVLCGFLRRTVEGQDPPVWHGVKWLPDNRARARQVTAKDVSTWVAQAGPKAVTDELDNFVQAIQQHALEMMSREDDVLDFFQYLGSGPFRDADLARKEYQRLSSSHADAEIRRYLDIYGYTNPKGTVGRWYHKHLQALQDNGSR
jgi:hypothetical protein